MHELLDIVDANDVIIGRETRAEIHRTGRLHRAVHMLVSNSRGEVFLQKRAAIKDINPNCWDSSAAGHLDSGEHYLPAAVRELEEELGVVCDAKDFHEFMRCEPSLSNGFEHQRFYAIRTDLPMTLCSVEIAEGRWFKPSDIDVWVASNDKSLTADLKLVWPVYLSQNHANS